MTGPADRLAALAPGRGPAFLFFGRRAGLVRIGYAFNPAATCHRLRAELLCARQFPRADEAREAARLWQDDYGSYRADGRWFRPARRLMGEIAAMAGTAPDEPLF